MYCKQAYTLTNISAFTHLPHMKSRILRTSLLVQWLRLCVPSAGGLGPTLIR